MLENTTLMQMKENIKSDKGYGIDKSYNRQKFDDPTKRRQVKEEFFGDKKTQTDYITGETLHVDSQAAKTNMVKTAIQSILQMLIILYLKNSLRKSKQKPLFN